MNPVLKFLPFALAVLTPSTVGAWSDPATRTLNDIKMLEMEVRIYELDHGKLPDVQEFRGKVARVELIEHSGVGPFLDEWGNEFIYRINAKRVEDGGFEIHSAGANGKDEAGARDDISSWAGVNSGHYFNKGKTSGRIVIIGSLALAAAVGFIGFGLHRGLAISIACLIASAGVSVGYYLLTMTGPPSFPEGNHVIAIGAAFCAFWGFLIVAAINNKPNKSTQGNRGDG